VKIIPLNQTEQLPDLVRFHFALHFLEVEELGNAWVREDVEEIAKPHIVRGHKYSLEKSSRSHSAKDPERGLGGVIRRYCLPAGNVKAKSRVSPRHKRTRVAPP
jgi:hypothetical protein